MSQIQVVGEASAEKSSLRTRILNEAKAALQRERMPRARTWTKRPKYEGQQFTLDLERGMSELRPSRKREPDVPLLSPKDFSPANSSPAADVQDRFRTMDSTSMGAAPDPIMMELDEILHESRAQSPDSASVQSKDGKDTEPHPQSSPKPLYSMPVDPRWPEMLLQPDSRPITQEQLAAEVKSIYAGLTMVESKCIHVDKAQSLAGREDWRGEDVQRGMLALHKTLLHEHHDFLLASQHPSASPALKRLALKYAMPNRMWRNGIHSVLEVLSQKPKEHSELVQEFLRTVHETMEMLQENIPGMHDEWTRIQEAVETFERKMLDQGELQYLHEQTSPLKSQHVGAVFEFGDIYNSAPLAAPYDHVDNDQLGGLWFPQHVSNTLSAWLYFGSGICAHNFNIFVKTFAVMAIAAWPTQHMWPLL